MNFIKPKEVTKPIRFNDVKNRNSTILNHSLSDHNFLIFFLVAELAIISLSQIYNRLKEIIQKFSPVAFSVIAVFGKCLKLAASNRALAVFEIAAKIELIQ